MESKLVDCVIPVFVVVVAVVVVVVIAVVIVFDASPIGLPFRSSLLFSELMKLRLRRLANDCGVVDGSLGCWLTCSARSYMSSSGAASVTSWPDLLLLLLDLLPENRLDRISETFFGIALWSGLVFWPGLGTTQVDADRSNDFALCSNTGAEIHITARCREATGSEFTMNMGDYYCFVVVEIAHVEIDMGGWTEETNTSE